MKISKCLEKFVYCTFQPNLFFCCHGLPNGVHRYLMNCNCATLSYFFYESMKSWNFLRIYSNNIPVRWIIRPWMYVQQIRRLFVLSYSITQLYVRASRRTGPLHYARDIGFRWEPAGTSDKARTTTTRKRFPLTLVYSRSVENSLHSREAFDFAVNKDFQKSIRSQFSNLNQFKKKLILTRSIYIYNNNNNNKLNWTTVNATL